VIEAQGENDDLFLNEAADLTYHLLVLLASRGFTLEDVSKVLRERSK
jgi:phosphoribosyl-ATP pyrophosphohydrolase/phosphoribosyl-AMP cyclohydrolase